MSEMTAAEAKSLYATGQSYEGEWDEPFYGPGDYGPLVESLGEVLVQVDDADYQGDSRLLLRDEAGRYGYLIFGWGSCSGCDALQACERWTEVADLRNGLAAGIHWEPTAADLLTFIENRDWAANDYSWHEDETKDFVAKAKAKLREAVS